MNFISAASVTSSNSPSWQAALYADGGGARGGNPALTDSSSTRIMLATLRSKKSANLFAKARSESPLGSTFP